MSSLPLPSLAGASILASATPSNTAGPKRGPVAKRRFQKGRFEIVNGVAYSLFYEDVQQPDGLAVSHRARHAIGRIGPDGMSERAARREHDRRMQEVNRKRGSVAPASRGETFADALKLWQSAVAPLLSPATVRQRECYLRVHVLPRFKTAALHGMGVEQLQQFATELRGRLSRKTVVNILSTVFAVFGYARRCGLRVSNVGFKDLELGAEPNERGLLFPNRACTRPRKRESVVQYALKPLLRSLGIDDKGGLHAFRHGLATELAEASVPIPVLQTQMRHADVKTTLRIYAHVIPQSQRDAMERAAIGTNVPIGTPKES